MLDRSAADILFWYMPEYILEADVAVVVRYCWIKQAKIDACR